MLKDFFNYVKSNTNKIWLHWNMVSEQYGFFAIENRFKVLGGRPIEISNDKKINVAHLFHERYGKDYIEDLKLTKLAEKNHLNMIDYLSGKDEATAFEEGKYLALYNSTQRKVMIISSFLEYSGKGTLETNAHWKSMYGVSVHGVFEFLREKWWFNIMTFVLGVLITLFIEHVIVA